MCVCVCIPLTLGLEGIVVPSVRLRLNFPFEEPSTLGGISGTGLLTLKRRKNWM